MSLTQPTVSFVTAPPQDARRIAAVLVGAQLAACVNVIPAVHSVYRWGNAIKQAEEALLVVKSTREALPALDTLLREIHPYETFELVSLDVQGGSAPYLDWIRASVAPPAP